MLKSLGKDTREVLRYIHFHLAATERYLLITQTFWPLGRRIPCSSAVTLSTHITRETGYPLGSQATKPRPRLQASSLPRASTARQSFTQSLTFFEFRVIGSTPDRRFSSFYKLYRNRRGMGKKCGFIKCLCHL